MANFSTAKLGKTSEISIRALDQLKASPATPYAFDITCSQVSLDLLDGDYLFIGFGSNNSKGAATDWVRGVRALGTVTNKKGGPNSKDQWVISVEIRVVLPQSVTPKDLLDVDPVAYAKFSGLPIVGMGANAQQTIQMVKSAPDQDLLAFFHSLSKIHPSFETDTRSAYPALAPYFGYASPAPSGTVAMTASAPSSTSTIDLSKIVKQFKADADAAELRINPAEAHRFFASLLSKRFLIASGLAGSGKTKLAQAFAVWLTPTVADGVSSKCYEVVPVGADWTGNENILGYTNGLDEGSYVSKPALDLILQAEINILAPHILILDEMNLSHVERYFADVLSVIESDEKINLHRDAERKSDGWVVPNEIGLPKNMFIIGTVNVDETTYMFSPKVLDRASVIEFRMDAGELALFLGNPSKPDLLKIAGKGAAFGPAFVAGASLQVPQFADPLKAQYEGEMLLFFKALRGNGAEFGYRVAHEAARFIHFYKLLGGHADADPDWFAKAFDCLVAQKFLPKLHGSRAKLGPLLKKLWFLCVADAAARGTDALAAAEIAAKSTEKSAEPSLTLPGGAPYAVSAEKIGRMWRLLNDNGFASFAEA